MSKKGSVQKVKDDFAKYYPIVMEWINNHMNDVVDFKVAIPKVEKAGVKITSCRFYITIKLENEHIIQIGSGYKFNWDNGKVLDYTPTTLFDIDPWNVNNAPRETVVLEESKRSLDDIIAGIMFLHYKVEKSNRY